MANSPCLITIRGIPTLPEINVRSGPGTNQALVFKAPVGTNGLQVIEVQPDSEQKHLNGKVYQWFKLTFADGRSGWARDDLVEIEGDATPFGYSLLTTRVYAFDLTRNLVTAPTPAAPTPADTAALAGQAAIVAGQAAQVASAAAQVAAQAAQPQPAAPAPTQAVTATVVMQGGANMRSGPSTTYAVVTRVDFNVVMPVLEVKPEEGGTGQFKWARVNAPGNKSGWIREDLVRFAGSVEAFGLGSSDLYPAPMQKCWFVRGFNLIDKSIVEHHGWDYGAAVGEPMFSGPKGGLVIKVFTCTKCTPDKPNFRAHGMQLSDSNGLKDAAWGFGYGNYVIVRYLNEQLPTSTQQELVRKALGGAHLFVMYAHLNSLGTTAGTTFTQPGLIGTCGDTGNSSGPHLHLEVRASRNANEREWSVMRPALLDPTILYSR